MTVLYITQEETNSVREKLLLNKAHIFPILSASYTYMFCWFCLLLCTQHFSCGKGSQKYFLKFSGATS